MAEYLEREVAMTMPVLPKRYRQFTPDDVYNSPVDCTVTDWMPLPNLPKK